MANPLAIVLFREQNDVGLTLKWSEGSLNTQPKLESNKEAPMTMEYDAYEIVKSGMFEDFVKLVEVR